MENNPNNILIICTDVHISHPLASWYYADDIDTDVCIQMFADVRWVGFLPPYNFYYIVVRNVDFPVQLIEIMEQHVLKTANNCLNNNIYSYLETSGGKS